MTTLATSALAAHVLVVGAGPAGIAAAARAAESGRSVVLVDESPEIGGQIWRHQTRATLSVIAKTWIARVEGSSAKILRGTSVIDMHGDGNGYLVSTERNGVPLVVRANVLVLATGARERFLPFPGWTMPGVIGIGGAQALLKSGTSFAGKRIVIAGSGPLLLPVAASLNASGAKVMLVAEQASARSVMGFALGLLTKPATLAQAARYRVEFFGTPYRLGEWVAAARGNGAVAEVDITDGVSTRTIACDVLCAAFGLVPNTELAQLLGCNISGGVVVVDAGQQASVAGVFCVGEATGIGGMDLAIAEGELAGLCAVGRENDARALATRRDRLRTTAHAMELAFALRPELRALATQDMIVCRCEDVRLGAIERSWSMRKAKLYTRAGMGPCQGRVCGAALEFLYGWPPDVVRLPSEPALFSTLIARSATASPSTDTGA